MSWVAWKTPRNGMTERGEKQLSRSLREPLLQIGNDAESFGIDFPGHGGPENGDAVGEAVDTHAVFGVFGGLLEPQHGSVVGFFDVNETMAARCVLKCL